MFYHQGLQCPCWAAQELRGTLGAMLSPARPWLLTPLATHSLVRGSPQPCTLGAALRSHHPLSLSLSLSPGRRHPPGAARHPLSAPCPQLQLARAELPAVPPTPHSVLQMTQGASSDYFFPLPSPDITKLWALRAVTGRSTCFWPGRVAAGL